MNTSQPSNWWHNKRVLVTGGGGFLGSFVVDLLLNKAKHISITSQTGKTHNINHSKKNIEILNGDLTNPDFALAAAKGHDVILHLAAKVAGIQYNVGHPVEMFNDTMLMGKNILEAAHKEAVKNVLMVSSACVYPRNCTIPTPESEGFLDEPEPTNLGYGWAKRVLELMSRFYHQEYKMNIAVARPYNLYGPRDTFDPEVSHVIPGLIKRVFDGENPLSVWGSGTQTRSFLYVKDCAELLLHLVERSTNAQPVNLSTDEEITIAELTKLIVELSTTHTIITFDTTKPDGQPRRKCDTNLMHKILPNLHLTPLSQGLTETISWYKQTHMLNKKS